MDIEEIKEQLTKMTDMVPDGGPEGWTRDNPRTVSHKPKPVAQALFWIIEKLQEVPTVEVLQLGPEDVLVGTFGRPVPLSEIEHYRNQLEGQFPDHRVVLIEGLALSVVKAVDAPDNCIECGVSLNSTHADGCSWMGTC